MQRQHLLRGPERRPSGRRGHLVYSLPEMPRADAGPSANENLGTLVFLPGALGNTRIWRPVADGLSHQGPRRFFGWPGFSGVPTDPSVNGLSDLVARAVESLREPTVMFAQSMGGVVAVRATLSKPDKVRGLVLAVTSGGVDTMARGAVDWRPDLMRLYPELPTWFQDESEDLSPRFREIRVPVLLLWGDADPLSPVAVGRHLADLLPSAELVVFEGGTHDLVLERADEVKAVIDRFLAKLSS